MSARSGRSARSFKSALGRSASVASSEQSEQARNSTATKSVKPLVGTGASLDLPENFFVDPDREEREEERRKIIADEILAASEDAKHVEFAWPGKGEGHFRKDHHRTAHHFASVPQHDEHVAAVTEAMLKRKYTKVLPTPHQLLDLPG